MIKLLIVVALALIFGSVSVAPDRSTSQRAREATLKENVFRVRDAIERYHADKNKYPASLEDLVREKYLRKLPEDW